ncbi:hypothetical protein ACFXGA_27030 [Actinosynnema sp. NPDC059335]|uniref:hypothetical protein n=1 Tax=Actinosynnema sp. NPDC059335 TaxID=3346804 RepID=UPI00366DFB38
MTELLTWTGTQDDADREWRLIHARDAQIAGLAPAQRAAINTARTTCRKCQADTPTAVRCHACGDWLNEAALADTDAAEQAIVERDARIAAAARQAGDQA